MIVIQYTENLRCVVANWSTAKTGFNVRKKIERQNAVNWISQNH